ncbi:MAG TPA: phosphotransferase [Dehalococcoidia bacterium]|nr:phosphotransferase [Dehalococcoidia bacterium]
MKEPRSISEIDNQYLSFIARKALNDDSVEVTSFDVAAEPFDFPRFGEKSFHDFSFSYDSASGPGKSCVILRVMPEMDAVMMLTGDTEHRELKAFQTGLLAQIPDNFVIPYLHVIDDDEHKQYWAFLRDMRPQVEALGMHTKVSDETCRLILSHLAEFHAKFWEKHSVIDQPWLMSLDRPVNYFYRCVVDILDGMEDPAESSVYITERWPWLAEGTCNLIDSLPPSTAETVMRLYRNPQPLLDAVAPMPKTLCHYDFDNRNLSIEEGLGGTRTVVLDWETLGRGISASDVVRFTAYQQPDDLDASIGHYLDALERNLSRTVDREEWRRGYDIGSVAEWQIRGVLFGVIVEAPSAPVPDEHRPAMRERVYADIEAIEALAKKHALV